LTPAGISGIIYKQQQESKTMENKTFNGWTNFETWQAALWMDNDYGVMDSITGDDGKIQYSNVRALLDCMTYEQAEQGILDTGLMGDIMTHGEFKGHTGLILAQWHGLVNIQEIVDNHNEG